MGGPCSGARFACDLYCGPIIGEAGANGRMFDRSGRFDVGVPSFGGEICVGFVLGADPPPMQCDNFVEEESDVEETVDAQLPAPPPSTT